MSEHKCVVSHCCCGCSLRGGSLAIGIISLIVSILNVLNGINLAVNHHDKGGWVYLVVNLIATILSILLILGIRQERRGYVMAWVWGMTVVVAINIIIIVVSVILTLKFLELLNLIMMAVYIYLIIVVRSHALTLSANPTMA